MPFQLYRGFFGSRHFLLMFPYEDTSNIYTKVMVRCLVDEALEDEVLEKGLAAMPWPSQFHHCCCKQQ